MGRTAKKETVLEKTPASSNELDFVPSGCIIPCDLDQVAFIPCWEKKNGEIEFFIDEYKIASICGCGEEWACTIKDKDNKKSKYLIPNIDVFFSVKDANKKINALKKTEDVKKMNKWRRKNIEDLGE